MSCTYTGFSQKDTAYVRQLLKESRNLQWDDREAAMKKLREVKALMGNAPYEKIKASYLYHMSDIHEVYNNSDSCIYYGNQALAIFEKIHNAKGIIDCYNTFGNNSYTLGNYTQSLDYYLKGLHLAIDTKDSNMVAALYNNIGNVYDNQSDKNRALEYYKKALAYNLKTGKKSWQGINYNNIGLLLESQGKFSEALDYLQKAYRIHTELEQPYDLALVVTNMGNCFGELKQPDSSEKYYRMGLALYTQLKVPEGIARGKVNLARLFTHKKRLDSALILAKEALQIAGEIHAPHVKMYAYRYISDIYQNQGDYKNAYKSFHAFSEIKDSLSGTEHIAETARLEAVFKFKEDQKEDSLRHEQEKLEQSILAARKEEKQKYIRYSLLMVIVLLTGFGIYVFINFRRKSKLSKALKAQKEIVEEKNQEITDSINYAKRIQHSLLPDENFLDQYFPSSFVMFRPKDIVSGDFYWFREKGDYIQVVLADCTGHGVPGAMMAVMGNTFLQEAADETQPDEPDRLLQVLDKKITTALRSKDQTTNDGMDCIVLSYHQPSETAYLASAKRPLLLLSGEDIIEIPGSKFSIGGPTYVNKVFGLVRHPMRENDQMYLFTDGITDQFGGEKGKKLKYAHFKNTVLLNRHMPMKEQLRLLNSSFEKWKGQTEQTDDVCVIGIKF